MIMKRIILYFLLFFSIQIFAEERPVVVLKAEYNYKYHYLSKTGDTIPKIYKFVLQLAPTKSYYYNPQTYFVDSMKNDPQGKIIMHQAEVAALEASASDPNKKWMQILKDQGLMGESSYRALKDFDAGNIRVWDTSYGDSHRYDVDMSDLTWELGDSIKNVLGFECQNAFTDYHGRKWEAWFTTDIPFQDGPWQLCGLPGLIMEAITEDGMYSFEITGVQECNEYFKPTFETDKYYVSKRKSFLKSKDYTRKNLSTFISSYTNGAVKLSSSVNAPKNAIDFIETDYHE